MHNVLSLAQAAQSLFEGVNSSESTPDPTRSPLSQMQMAQQARQQQQQSQLQQQQPQQLQQQQPRPQQRQMSLGQMTPLQQQQFLKMNGGNMYNGAAVNQPNMLRQLQQQQQQQQHQQQQQQNYMKQQNYLQNMGMAMSPGMSLLSVPVQFVCSHAFTISVLIRFRRQHTKYCLAS